MRSVLMGWMLLSVTSAFGGDQLTVAICNMSQLPATAIGHAKDETAYVFESMGVEIHWLGCGDELGAPDPGVRPDFIVRVQMGGHVAKRGPVSLEAMGRAFMDSTGYGYMVDTYYGAIRDLTLQFPFAGQDQLLGYVIAHELGHLLIGAGHRPNGIMRASWGKGELEALNRRHLKFNDWERNTIIHKLQAGRTVSAEVARVEP